LFTFESVVKLADSQSVECCVGVALETPGVVDLGIQPNVDGAPVSRDICYRNGRRVQKSRCIDVFATS
jgi:hypothetical protein